MKLTEHEQKVVVRLRMEERMWKWFRWIRLVLCLIVVTTVLLAGSSMFQTIRQNPQLAQPLTMAFALVSPLLCAAGVLATVGAVHTILHWQGNRERQLLLRVLDDLLDGGSQPAGGG